MIKTSFYSLTKASFLIVALAFSTQGWSQTFLQIGQDIDGESYNDLSGRSVSMPDANTVAIGATGNDGNGSDAGHVRIYSWDGSSWSQKGVDIDGESSFDQSGWSVSMPDANTVAIGAIGNDGNGTDAGHVRIYSWDGSSWTQKGVDIDGESSYDQSGWSVSMPDANTVAIGARFNDGNGSNSGHVRIYSWDGSSWSQKGVDIDGEYSSDYSGQSVSMPDANTVAIGAYANDGNGSNSGHVRIYSWDGSSWSQKGIDIDGEYSSDYSGQSVSMPDANTVAIGAYANDGNGSYSGHVRIYSWDGSSWSQKGVDIDGEFADDLSGQSVSMPDANTVAIGATGNDGNGNSAGHVRIYSWDGSSWTQKRVDIDGEASGDQSGYSVSMPDANTVAIGAPYNDGNSTNSGHVRIYDVTFIEIFPNSYGCIECDFLNVGELFVSSGDTIIVVDRPMLDSLINIQYDLSKVCVSQITDFSYLSFDSGFNDNIGSWDISNGTTMAGMFKGASSFNQDIGNWNTINVTDMSSMFEGASSFNQSINNWDVSNVLNMSVMFNGASSFNQNLNSWNVSNVTDMSSMFKNGNSFNGYIENWDVSNVISMAAMFQGASAYNQTLYGWRYRLDSVLDMSSMFKNATSFNSPGLHNWWVGHVTDMSSMFEGATNFNYSLRDWNVSNVTDMSSMFKGATSFNQNISNWNTSNVTDMSSMFEGASSFNQNIQSWNTSNVTDMSSMFYDATNFDSPLFTWDVSSVTDMQSMFLFATSFDRPLWTWKVNNVSNMDYMFHFASSFNQDLTSWCVDTFATEPIGFALNSPLAASNKPTWGSCREAFVNASNCLECDQFAVGEWFSNGDSILVVDRAMLDSIISGTNYQLDYVCVSQVTNLDSLFEGQTIRGGMDAWDVSNVTSMVGTFAGQSNFNQDIGNWDVSAVTDMSHLFTGNTSFNKNIGAWDVSNVTDMSRMFYQASNYNSPMNNWDVGNVVNMESMFFNARKFNQDIGNWNVVQVTDMNYAFFFATDFNQDIGNWDTRNVTGMNSMFLQAQSFDQDLKPWCMSKIGSEPTGFALNSGLQANNYPRWGVCEAVPGVYINNLGCIECDSLNVGDFFVLDGDSIEVVDRTRLLALVAAQGDLTKVCVSHVQNMKNIFRGAKWFNQDITKWDMSNVTNAVNMFFNAEIFNQDLSTWDVSSVTNMTGMFFRADSFNQNLNVWDVSQVTGMSRMFGEAASFNGKIDQWDVSGVNRMTEMFKDATSFNQDLSSWCVSNFEYNAPTNFALNSPLLPSHYPIWGNCPTPYGDHVLALATGAFIDSSGCVDCSALNVGDYFTLGGDTMLVVDRFMLDSLVILRRDLSKVCVSHITDMKDALRGLRWFNTDISGWDVSNVTDMTNMFFKSKIFNQEIGNWNVSSVTNMNRMFQKSESFNGDLSNWDVSNVTKMNATFFGASAFNQDIGDWDVGNVTVAEAMFRNAGAFSQDLSMWCVTNIAVKPNLFDWNAGLTSSQLPVWGTCPTPPPYQILPNGCVACDSLSVGDQFVINGKTYTVANRAMIETRLNQSTSPDLTDLCVTHVTNMDYLLYNRTSSNPNISNWDVRNVKKTKWMFRNARAFNNNIGNWDVSGFTDMSYMFYQAYNFNQDIGNWDVSNVTDMSYIFAGGHVGNTSQNSAILSRFNKSLNNWDVSSVVNMSHMFDGARYFNSPIGNWDVSNVTDMSYMFYQAGAFNQYVGNWDVSNVINMESMFHGFENAYYWHSSPTPNIPFNQDIGNWDVSSVINMSNMFRNATAFNQDLNNWDVSNVVNFQGMFQGSYVSSYSTYSLYPMIYNQNMDNWDVSSGENFSKMFYKNINFNKDIGDWDVSNATNMTEMFREAYDFNQDIGGWNVSNVSSMTYMFYYAHVFFQDLSNWCVPLISSEPSQFHSSQNGTLSLALKPIWGTCPVASIAAPDQTDWNTNSTIEGQGNALNLDNGNGISIYPNPTTGIINLDPVTEGTYRLYNEIGRLIDQGKIQPRFDLSNFDNGIYVLLLQTANESKYFKVIKQ